MKVQAEKCAVCVCLSLSQYLSHCHHHLLPLKHPPDPPVVCVCVVRSCVRVWCVHARVCVCVACNVALVFDHLLLKYTLAIINYFSTHTSRASPNLGDPLKNDAQLLKNNYICRLSQQSLTDREPTTLGQLAHTMWQQLWWDTHTHT